MDLVRTLVTLGRGTREKEKIKVRQPLESILIDGKYEDIISDLTPLIMEELNIKKVIFEKNLDEYMNYSLKPNFRLAGPVLGKNIKAFGAAMAQADPKEVMQALEADGKLTLELNGESVDIEPEMVEVRIDAKEGFAVAMENNVFTILDTTITPELETEGLARELISKIQQMRKQNDYEMMDNIKIFIDADEDAWATRLYELTDERAVDETYAYLREHGTIMNFNYIGDRNSTIGPNLTWGIMGGAAAEQVEAARLAMEDMAAVFNGDKTQEQVDAEKAAREAEAAAAAEEAAAEEAPADEGAAE